MFNGPLMFLLLNLSRLSECTLQSTSGKSAASYSAFLHISSAHNCKQMCSGGGVTGFLPELNNGEAHAF